MGIFRIVSLLEPVYKKVGRGWVCKMAQLWPCDEILHQEKEHLNSSQAHNPLG